MKENKKTISPDEFKKKMKEFQMKEEQLYFFSKEEMHIAMDNLMCEVLENLGYKDGVEIFRNTGKWYS